MSPPAVPQSFSHQHHQQDQICGCHECRKWRDGSTQDAISLGAACSYLQADVIHQFPIGYPNFQHTSTAPTSFLDHGDPEVNINEINCFFNNPDSVLPQTDMAANALDSHFPEAEYESVAMFDRYGYPTSHQPEMDTFNNWDATDERHMPQAHLLGVVRNQPLFTSGGTYPAPFSNISEHVTNNDFADFYTSNLQDVPWQLTTTDQHQVPQIPPFQMSLSTNALTPWGSNDIYADAGPHCIKTHIPFRGSLSSASYDITLQTLQNIREYERLPSSFNIGRRIQTLKRETLPNERLLAPKPSHSSTAIAKPGRNNKNSNRRAQTARRQRARPVKDIHHRRSMRAEGACAICRVQRVSCSSEGICERCKKRGTPLFGGTNCHKGPLVQYHVIFSPPFLRKHLRQPVIESFTTAKFFIGSDFTIEVTTGKFHPRMIVSVCEYLPESQSSLLMPDLTKRSNDHMKTLATTSSLPYALRNYNFLTLKDMCQDHIQAISNMETMSGEFQTIPGKIFQVISRFHDANPIAKGTDLLRKVIMALRIYYVQGVQIILSKKSASKALENLQNPLLPPPSFAFWTARSLNRQFKAAMQSLLEDLQWRNLEEFERELRKDNKDNWGLCLCVFLAFCICVESLQINVDGFVQFRTSEDDPELTTIREDARQFCCNMEQLALQHFWGYVEHKLTRILKPCNLLKHGFPVGEVTTLNESEVDLVNGIRKVIIEDEIVMSEMAEKQYYGGSPQVVDDHKRFRESNRGRVLSRPLMSLFRR